MLDYNVQKQCPTGGVGAWAGMSTLAVQVQKHSQLEYYVYVLRTDYVRYNSVHNTRY